MKTRYFFPAVFFGLSLSLGVYAASPSLSLFSPVETPIYSGSFSIDARMDNFTGTGFLDCTITRSIGVKKPLYSTGVVITPTETNYTLTFHPEKLKLKNGAYQLGCKIYSLENNALLSIAKYNFRYKAAPPMVIFSTQVGNLIQNPSFELYDRELPAFWKQGTYGRSTYTQDHLFTGIVGSGSVRTTILSYTNGDVKWYFYDVPVTGGKVYVYSQKYHTTTNAKITARYTMKDGTYLYDEIESLPTTQGPFASKSVYLMTPKDAVSMTVWTALSSEGSLLIDDVSLVPNF